MSGSGALVCDAAGLHSRRVDRMAKAEGAIKLDGDLMTMSSSRLMN
jgi:hypothetical protein